MSNAELARKLFDALEGGDNEAARALCSAGCEMSQNGGAPVGIEAMLGFSDAIGRVVANRRYVDFVTRETSDGFVEEHDFVATLLDGTELRAAVCVVASVTGGKVTSLREYVDTRAMTPLLKALQG